ncbi:MAG: zinc ribbon domain-containing protein [Methanobrevibacter sp.]|nr:zinc ribbon domain-containing protein [Methanobrevibacter sp.]
MKSCDVCGTLNLKEDNFCSHCGNKFITEHVCPFCGEVNPNHVTHCVKCGNQINPITIDDFDTLFSQFNKNLLANAEISDMQYQKILSNIFVRADFYEIYGDTIKNKILNFASIFTECKTKARGYERGFIFFGKYIYYDDRLDDSVQIATIIHELGHYFLFNIVENLLCEIFKVNTSTTLQSFVWYFLTLPEFKVMNEYCAHTVEGRFIPYGYQNYGSFNLLVEHMQIDKDSLDGMVVFGNTFANEIIMHLEKYIDNDLRQEIKMQYRKDSNEPTYKSILTETDDCLSLNLKNRTLIQVLSDIFEEASEDNIKKELEIIKEGFELN